jgi:O-antigen/teichoic acid export membrane protein
MKQKILDLLKNPKMKNFFIYGLGQSFNLLSPLVVAPYLIFVCKEDGFGKIGLGFAMSLFLVLIVDYAFEIKGVKLVSEQRNNKFELQRIINTTIFTKIVLFFITIVIAFGLIFFVPFFNEEKKLFTLSLLIVFAQVFNPIWFLQGIENFSLASILNVSSKTIYVVLVFVYIDTKNDYILVNFFLGISALFINILGLLIIKNKFKFQIQLPGLFVVKTIIKEDFFFCISQLSLSLRQLSPLVLTSFFLGYFVAGQYKVVEQIISLFRTFIQVFLKFFYPRACYNYSLAVEKGFFFWKRYSSINLIFIGFSLLWIFFFSKEILYFFNISITTIEKLDGIFRTSLLISFLMGISLPLEQLMFLVNKNKIYITITIFVTIINVLLIIVLIKFYDLMGIVFALILSELLFIALYYKQAYLYLKNQKAK